MSGSAEAFSGPPPDAAGYRIRMAAAEDRHPILDLLSRAGLPTDDLSTGAPAAIWIAEHSRRTVGVIGLERYHATGLLRSLAVLPEHRGRGLGATLVRHLEIQGAWLGVTELVLLTETATPFFARFGYRVIDRREAPESVRASTEFGNLCPVTAICMIKTLAETAGGRDSDPKTRRGRS